MLANTPMRALNSLVLLAVLLGASVLGPGCARRAPSFLGQPLPVECREQSDLTRSRRCLGWILDRAFIARTHRYQHESLTRYVDTVGQRLAAQTDRSEYKWTFRILDDADVQAYALVGGYVYVSRGALAILASEAELAALLAHEIAHVAAGHSEDTILSMVDATREYDQLFARYFERERDEERQADELAAAYMRRAGYEPRAMLSMLRRIHRDARIMTDLYGASDSDSYSDSDSSSGDGDSDSDSGSSWQRTHPPGHVRRARVARIIAGWAPAEVGRERYNRAIQGLVVGRDPRSGIVAGQTYVHVKAGLSWQLGDNWQLTFADQSPRAVTERSGRTLFATVMPIGLGHYHFYIDGLTRRRTVKVGGRAMTVGWLTPDATSSLSMDAQVDEVRHIRAGLLALPASHLLIMVTGAERKSVTAAFSEVVRGLRPVRAREIRAVQPPRVVGVRAPRTATVSELAAELCPTSAPLTIFLDGGQGDDVRPAGTLLRCVRPGD